MKKVSGTVKLIAAGIPCVLRASGVLWTRISQMQMNQFRHLFLKLIGEWDLNWN